MRVDSSIGMGKSVSAKGLEKAWHACLAKALRPVEGVLLAKEEARSLAESLLNQELETAGSVEGEASLTAHCLRLVTQSSKEFVAEDRLNSSDEERYRDPADKRYERNLSLPRLQRKGVDGGFLDTEWSELLSLLKPFGYRELQKKGVLNQDAEDVYSETFTELTREGKTKAAPIMRLTVFEEVIPLFVRMIQFRRLDWLRSRNAKKNQPNTQESIEELASEERGGQQFTDTRETSIGSDQPLSFDAIYYQCQEQLSSFEWHLVFSLYVAQRATMGELIEEERTLSHMGLTRKDSPSTRRRRLNEHLDEALTKLRENLEI